MELGGFSQIIFGVKVEPVKLIGQFWYTAWFCGIFPILKKTPTILEARKIRDIIGWLWQIRDVVLFLAVIYAESLVQKR